MQQIARRIAQMEEFKEKLKSIETLVPPGVVKWRYTFERRLERRSGGLLLGK
jgi:hypothetical protein